MKKHKLLIAAIVFGLTWAGIVRAEDLNRWRNKPSRQYSSTAHGRILQAGTASSISCSKTVTPSEPYRILCAEFSADAAVISNYLKSVAGPVVLVGHSYGGSVISVASANAPNVKALVFVDAFAPDAGESVQTELASAPPPPADFTIAVPFTSPDGNDADLYVNSKYFGTVFASSEPADVAARLAVTQRPFAARCLTDKAPEAVGWKTISSWFVIGDADKVIPPDILLKFATRAKLKIYHVPGGDHPSMIAHPEVTVAAILDAANAVSH